MTNINSRSTKAQIIEAAESQISHLESTLYNSRQVLIISAMAVLIGFFGGLAY